MAGRRCLKYRSTYSPTTGGMVRRCSQFGSGGGGFLGSLGSGVPSLGQSRTLKATFGDVKDVVVTAAIGAGGAILTDIVFDQLAKNIEAIGNMSGYTRALMEAATGIAIGIMVGKLMKKPRLGAKIATGPVVLAALRIAGELLNAGPYAAERGLSDIGMMAIDPFRPELAGGDLGSMQVGPGTPGWMLNQEGGMAGDIAGIAAAA